MHRTPPREDENFDQSQPSYPPQRRKTVVRLQHPIGRYHSDNHHEVPKIRRASLRLDDVALPPSNPSQHLTHPESTAKMAHSKKAREAVRSQDALDDQRPAQKIIVAKRRRPPVYEPPTPARYSSRGRRWRQRSILGILQDISHNQTAILITT